MNRKATLLCLALAQTVLCSATPVKTGAATWKKYSDAAERLVEKGRYKEAEAALRAAADQSRAFGTQDKRYADTLFKLASVLRYQARYSEAEAQLKQVLALRKSAPHKQALLIAETLNALASVYRAQGKFEEAAPLYEEALDMAAGALGPGHPELARFQIPQHPDQGSSFTQPSLAVSLNNLADLYRAQGKLDQAERLYKQALEVAEKKGEPGHPDVIVCLNNLADLYAAQGKPDEAEPLYERAMALTLQATPGQGGEKNGLDAGGLGRRNPDLALSLNSLADFKRAQGKLDEAERLYKQALETDEEALGPNHPALAVTLNNLADLYAAQGRRKEAERLERRANRIREMSLASEQLDINTYRQALALDEMALGSWHPDVAVDLNSLADVYRAT
ncbi:MAG TPA: tetratricopeptide repeat protein, partial [Candidatus Obscuribacterales bacterium]